MIKYISALTLALFSLSAVAQNTPVPQTQPAAELQHVLVAQANTIESQEEATDSEPAPGAAAGGVGARQVDTPVVIGVVGAVAVGIAIAASGGGGGGGSSTSHH